MLNNEVYSVRNICANCPIALGIKINKGYMYEDSGFVN